MHHCRQAVRSDKWQQHNSAATWFSLLFAYIVNTLLIQSAAALLILLCGESGRRTTDWTDEILLEATNVAAREEIRVIGAAGPTCGQQLSIGLKQGKYCWHIGDEPFVIHKWSTLSIHLTFLSIYWHIVVHFPPLPTLLIHRSSTRPCLTPHNSFLLIYSVFFLLLVSLHPVSLFLRWFSPSITVAEIFLTLFTNFQFTLFTPSS